MPDPRTHTEARNTGQTAQMASQAATPEQSVRSAQNRIRSKLDARATALDGLVDQFTRSFGLSPDKASELTGRVSRNMEVASEVGAVMTRGCQEASREWFEIAQARFQNYVEHMAALGRCGSVQELVATQQKIAQDLIQEFSENGTRMAKVAGRIVEETRRAIAAEAESRPGRVTNN
jgi:hypothetical protein